VQPFAYSQTWILIDEDGTEYIDIGTKWARERDLPRDSRRITEVGILPGSSLTVIAKSGAVRRTLSFRRRLDDLVMELGTILRKDGISVENVSGAQRPRLLVNVGHAFYGIYAMPGRPKDHDDWVGLARAASAGLEADRSFPITPVLALERQPSARVLDEAAASNVLIMWLENGKLQDAPWAVPDRHGAP
jgi:hypothetical protein